MTELKPDHYTATAATTREPPRSISSSLKFLGPGFILSASIVGSGELIATTTLGAKAGFTAFWIIIVSCLVKVAIQLEFGKYAILTGETAMKSFNTLPGLRLGKASWAVWAIFLLTLLKVVQVGGMLGGTAIVMSMLFPSISVIVWAVIISVLAFLLIYRGLYGLIEKSSLVMIALFTLLTFASLIALNFSEYNISGAELLSGLKLKLPASLVVIAIAAFGITGVGSDEIIAYNYWCLEKGYAAFAGPKTPDEAWKKRARGWIKVMYLDAFVAMVIYTLVTAAFYLLGAAVLHRRGLVPEGNEVIETLALIYTQSLGSGIKSAYLVGAFFVLFSSVFATLAAWSRLFSDIFGQLGWINFHNTAERKKMIAILSWVFPVIWLFTFIFINLPVIMILFGGVVGSVMLLVVVFAAIIFHKRRLAFFKAGLLYEICFWLSIIAILMVALLGVAKLS
ncbi:Nramp family divalent metal transporter [Flavitalea sp.]|nr:Nramp family divalent metal transporter [Flavitalea sp.]